MADPNRSTVRLVRYRANGQRRVNLELQRRTADGGRVNATVMAVTERNLLRSLRDAGYVITTPEEARRG